ncbi:MAG: serine/threonine protein kinase [Burkholderiales bacterium]|nr:serine/threonine protein kinase [Burkholderiales bacterium]
MPSLPGGAPASPEAVTEDAGFRTLVPDRAAGRLRTRFIASRRRRSLVVLAVCAIVAAAAVWMYVGVERSIRELRAQGLPALLDAKTKSLEVFIAERRNDGERWARDPQIAAQTADLARQASGRDLTDHCRSRAVEEWRALFVPLLKFENVAAVNTVDRNGRIIASTLPEICGLRAQQRTMAPQLAQVFAGHTQFIRPFAADSQLVAAQPFLGTRPLAWVETPSRDASGNVVAAIGFASYVDRDFEAILSAARPGETGEAYAFDETGTLLSEVRDLRGLHRAGLLPEGATSAAFRLKVRDPGVELEPGVAAPGGDVEWPLTRPVMLSLTAGAEAARRGLPAKGVLLDPYRNYRGAEVIGAWRWLPEERLGVVAEIGVGEAYAPLRYVRVTIATVMVLLVLTAGWAAWSTLALARLTAKPAAGRRIGAYRLERELAEGGSATVHLARHALLKRPTAIKILKRHMATDELSARFEREVRLVSELQHPNTIEIYDYGHTNDGLLYYAMEYVDGLSLDALLAREPTLPLERIRHIVVQVCAALAEVHAKGMVHRDIKPQNVMVCERGGEYDFVKLLDFGIVKRIEAVRDDHPDANRVLTRQVRLLGTPAYMPPERIGAPSDVDARSDIYGVGALIYFLVCGRAPFVGDDEAAILRQVLATSAPRISDALPGVPPALDDLVARCLAKVPEERPAAVDEIVGTLTALELPSWTRDNARTWWGRWRAGHASAVAQDASKC